MVEIAVEEESLAEAAAGDNVRLRIKGLDEEQVAAGDVVCRPPPPDADAGGAGGVGWLAKGVTVVQARISILECKSIISAGALSLALPLPPSLPLSLSLSFASQSTRPP